MIHPYTNHIKMMNAKTEDILKTARTKQLIMYNRSKIRLTADPSANTMEVRRHCKGILKMLKSKGKGLCGLPNSQQNCQSLRIELRFLFSKSTSLILNTISLISMGIKPLLRYWVKMQISGLPPQGFSSCRSGVGIRNLHFDVLPK